MNNLYENCEVFIVLDSQNGEVLLKTIANTEQKVNLIKHYFRQKGYKIECLNSNDGCKTFTMYVSKAKTQYGTDLHLIYQNIMHLSPKQRELLLGWLIGTRMQSLNNINDSDKKLRHIDNKIDKLTFNYHVNPFEVRKQLIHFLRQFR